jgi:hypothetical protein
MWVAATLNISTAGIMPSSKGDPMESSLQLKESAGWKSVRECFDEHRRPGSRFITKYENYFDVYDRYLLPFRERPVKLIEIGVQHGGSLQMWRRYLHPESIVIGIDIYAACKRFEEDGIRIFIGDQSDHLFLQHVIDDVGTADIVIDDGSHIPSKPSDCFVRVPFPVRS